MVVGAIVLAAGPLASESANAVVPTFTITDLGDSTGLLGSYATDINDSGHVIVNGATVYSWSRAGGFVNIGNLGGVEIVGRDINAYGQIVGYAEIPGPPQERHAFIWTPGGSIVDLGTAGVDSDASAINDSGQVVGMSGRNAFSWTAAGGMVNIGAVGEDSSHALDVNNVGQVVVRSIAVGPAFVQSSYVWSAPNVRQPLGDLGGGSTAGTVINASGAVVGDSRTASGATHPIVWTAAGGLQDLDPSAGSFGTATAINDAGMVAGRINRGAIQIAFFWSSAPTGIVDLPTLGGAESEAAAINEQGDVVGYSVGLDMKEHGFLWTGAEGTIDLGVADARDINELGQIAATQQLPSSPRRAALVERFVNPDANGDGIDDSLQAVSGRFTDNNTPVTSGSVVDLNGNGIRITDVAAPDGVRIAVTGVGTATTTFSVCGMTLRLAPGSEVIVTCGSLKVSVISGSAEISVGGDRVAVTVPAGATAKVSVVGDEYRIENLGAAGTVTVAVDGVPSTVPPGGTNVVSLAVAYPFQGFASPIDNLPTVNSAKAGQTVPVTWRITDSHGVGISDPASFKSVTSVSGSCSLSAPLDAVEVYSGSSGLQYLGDGWWQFNWKTPKTYVGLCREMHLNLADGSVHNAAFKFM